MSKKSSGDYEFHECVEVVSFSTESSPEKSCDTSKEEYDNDDNVCACDEAERSKRSSFEADEKEERPLKRGSLRRLSRSISKELVLHGSSMREMLPETPVGWTLLVTTLFSGGLGYEIRLQQSLTRPPLVFGQCLNGPLQQIHNILTKNGTSILSRDIQPSLFVGTRGTLASAAAFALGGPSSHDALRFREHLTTSQDGATLAIDWELPQDLYSSSVTERQTFRERQQQVLKGPIEAPAVVITLHGINNDTSFGYMRSLMRACTDRGWIAVGMNFRGCGGVKLTTPRGYTGAYTGDLRHVVRTISTRLGKKVPLFLVGNSLGANLMVKYLGEEGFCGTLPHCVAGGVSLGNPLKLDPRNMGTPWKHLLSLGTRKMVLEHYRYFRKMTSSHFQQRIRQSLCSNTIGAFDDAMSQIFIRNEDVYPFTAKVGYRNGDEYWDDGSSYRVVQHVSVPLLNILSQDDFLVYGPSSRKLSFCLENPNVMVVTTKCGGHLGWQESPPDSDNIFGVGISWADTATAEFIDAVLSSHPTWSEQNGNRHDSESFSDVKIQEKSDAPRPRLRSKL